MTNNQAFPAPVPALSALSAAVSDLQAAETSRSVAELQRAVPDADGVHDDFCCTFQ